MSDLVETMFSVDATGANRNVWWANPDGSHKYGGTGTAHFIQAAPNSAEALRILGPAFSDVEMRSVFTSMSPAAFETDTSRKVIHRAASAVMVLSDKHKACTRVSDGRVFGIFSPEFAPVQPRMAFAVMDDLLGEGCTFETAGTLKDGAVQWMLATLPEAVKIAGEDYKPYLLARNAHDGSMAFCIQFATTRVVCANTLAIAMGEKANTYRTRHVGDVLKRVDEARTVLRLGRAYIARVQETAEALLSRSFSFAAYEKLAGMLLPEPKADVTDRIRANWQTQLAGLVAEWGAADLSDIKGTAWGALQAVASYSDHALATSRGSADAKGTRQFANAFDDASGLKAQAFALLRS